MTKCFVDDEIDQSLAGLFLQALQLCQAAGLVKMGHVALDGTKKQANASKHKAISYGRMDKAEEELRIRVLAVIVCCAITH